MSLHRAGRGSFRSGKRFWRWAILIEALSITPNLATQLEIPFVDYGVMITDVIKDGNISINSISIKNVLDYFSVLEESRPGDVYEIEYLRDGETLHTTIRLSERPEPYR